MVIGSNTGSDRPPAWALNLLANPDARVQIGGELRDVRARVTEGDERLQLWNRMNARYGAFEEYRARTDRELHVFALEPR